VFDNFVLFHVRGGAWTLGGTSVALAVVMIVICLACLPLMMSRYGSSRRMSTSEAQRRSVVGHAPSYDPGHVVVAGPAMGKQWSYEFTIGSLRAMRERGEYFAFYLLPGYMIIFLSAFMIGGLGLALLTRGWPFLVFTGAIFLLILIPLFMMWAAVNTDLQ
jgi:hypothetical protein